MKNKQIDSFAKKLVKHISKTIKRVCKIDVPTESLDKKEFVDEFFEQIVLNKDFKISTINDVSNDQRVLKNLEANINAYTIIALTNIDFILKTLIAFNL